VLVPWIGLPSADGEGVEKNKKTALGCVGAATDWRCSCCGRWVYRLCDEAAA
jgi:hypothetical protein